MLEQPYQNASPRPGEPCLVPLGRKTLDLGKKPLVMGVLNVTPDSFYDGGRYDDPARAVGKAAALLRDGADIIDIGGESTRPGSAGVSAREEMDRVVPVVEAVCREFDAVVSVDTTKAAVAAEALDRGACMVNDISGLAFEPGIAAEVSRRGAAIVLGHTPSRPLDMQENTSYRSLVPDVIGRLEDSAAAALDAGVPRERIIIDPGIGFGKTVGQNLEILGNLEKFCDRGFAVCVGTSRKSFLGAVLGDCPAEKRLIGSVSSVIISMLKGSSIVRVHDVLETRQAIETVKSIYGVDRTCSSS